MKGNNNTIKFLILLAIIVVSVMTAVVLANSELKVIDAKYKGGNSSILYSDNRLLYWTDEKDEIYENVEKYSLGYDTKYEPYILTNDGKLTYETLNGKQTKTNIQDFVGIHDEEMQIILYLDNNNNLYFETLGDILEVPDSISNVSKLYYDEQDESIAFLVEDKLYAFLTNTYEKVNKIINEDLLILYEPRIVAENVKYFGDSYYVTNDNKLYVFGELLVEDVKSVNKVLQVSSYEVLYELTTQSNEKKCIYTSLITNQSSSGNYYYVTGYNEIEISESIKNAVEVDNQLYILTEGNNLYKYEDYDEELIKINENIKDITSYGLYYGYMDVLVYLNENNELFIECKDSYCNLYDDFTGLANNYYLNEDEKIQLLKNVESIEYFQDRFVLMTDKSVYRYGSNSDNEFRNEWYSSTETFVQINELINDYKPITTNQIIMNFDDKIENQSSLEPNVVIIPENSEDYDYTYDIEDESIIVYNETNENFNALKEGNTQLCAVLNSNESIKECKDIIVYPQLQGIQIEQGDSIDVEEYEIFKINILKNPLNNYSDLNISYEAPYNFDIMSYYYDETLEEYVYAEENEFFVKAYNGGTYELRFYDENTGFEDTITVNITENIYFIEPIIPNSNFDGVKNAYIYLKKSNKLNVSYYVYYETANNKNVIWSSSDTSVATVDQNGLITAYKPGRTVITLTAADGGGAKATFNVIVQDSYGGAEMAGDVNEDGSINILDIIKMRKYLAGLEDEL